MKIKKILAAVAAAAVAVSAMAVNVFASEAAGPSKQFTVSVNDDKENGVLKIPVADFPAGTTEIKFEISFSGDGAYGGGAIGRNVNGTWTQDDTNFSNDKPETHNLTINATEIDTTADANGNAQIEVQCWWVGGGSMTVKSTYVIDDSAVAAPADDGSVDEAAPAPVAADDNDADDEDSAPADNDADEADEADSEEEDDADEADSTPADNGNVDADTDSTPAGDSTTTSNKTGNVPAVAMVSVMALAGVAAVASKKRK